MASKKRSGLGRGMDALFQNYEETPGENEVVERVALSEIRANPYQPRKVFNEEALQELADSIKQSGVFQPVILRQSAIQGYELIAGERRVRASRLAGETTIPAIIRQLDDVDMIEIAVLENLQREDLRPIEEAEAYNMLMEQLNLTQAEVAERMGKSRPYIANYLRLLSLPEAVKEMVGEDLSMGQARTLLGLKDKSQIPHLAERIVREGLRVRQIEEIVQSSNASPEVKPPVSPDPPTRPRNQYLVLLEERMEEYFGTQTKIKQKGQKGTIEIEFLSDQDLTRILDLLKINL